MWYECYIVAISAETTGIIDYPYEWSMISNESGPLSLIPHCGICYIVNITLFDRCEEGRPYWLSAVCAIKQMLIGNENGHIGTLLAPGKGPTRCIE